MPSIPFLTQLEPASRKYVGAYIRHLRTDLHMSQLQLAYATGYSVVTISRIETGKANPMGVAGRDILTALASLHGMDDANDMLDDWEQFVSSEEVIFEPLQ